MPPQTKGMVGGLPLPAWSSLRDPDASWLGSYGEPWSVTLRELRRTCKALAELVSAGCVGEAGFLYVNTADKAAQLEAAATAGLGRALQVTISMPLWPPQLEEHEVRARALALAVERGHMIWFESSGYKSPSSAVTRMVEATLIEASRKSLLLHANFDKGESHGWSVGAMAQLSSVELNYPKRETVATLVGAGALQRFELGHTEWADVSILSSLRKVVLSDNYDIKDVSPLADVPLLEILECGIEALPAMRNAVLKVSACHELSDLSGLAGGHVGRLELEGPFYAKDLSAIWAMQPPPRSVALEGLEEEQAQNVMQNVSMLAGINRLELSPGWFEEDDLEMLEETVGTLILSEL